MNVTTVEIDRESAEQARRNLEDAGRLVTVVTGDGEAGHPANAAYDRVVACSWSMPLHGQRIAQPDRDEYRARWAAAGSPECARFGVTVSPDGQTIWRDTPDRPVEVSPVPSG